MIKATIGLLAEIANIFSAIHELIVQPNEDNQAMVIMHASELQNAYERFDMSMNKAQREIEHRDISRLRQQFSLYDSTIDQHFLDVLQKGKQIIQDVLNYKLGDLLPLAKQLFEMSKALYSEWENLSRAVLKEDPRHIQNYFNSFRGRLCEFKDKAISLSVQTMECLKPKITKLRDQVRNHIRSPHQADKERESSAETDQHTQIKKTIHDALIPDLTEENKPNAPFEKGDIKPNRYMPPRIE